MKSTLKEFKIRTVIAIASIGISMFLHPLQGLFGPLWFVGWLAAMIGWWAYFKPAMDLIEAIDESLKESESEET